MKLLITSLLALFTFYSISQTLVKKTIKLAPHLSFENYEHYKRLILNSPDSPIEFLDGFQFEWGYQYLLRVKETKFDETLSDGTQFDYSFIKIISKTKVPDSTEFKLTIDPNRYYHQDISREQEMNTTLKQINDSTYLYFDKVEIEVPKNLKQKFDLILSNNSSKLGSFIFINETRIRLVGFK